METEDLDDSIPFVVMYDIGRLEPDGIAIRLTYATSKERFDNRQWDTAVFGLPLSIATQLVKSLQKEIGPNRPAKPERAKRH